MTGRSSTPCRALVGGFGRPGMRDLDFGRHVVDCLQQLNWPEDVVVEDLACSAPLVLDRLQELRPAKVVLVGAVARDFDPPATLRRYQVDRAPAGLEETPHAVEEPVMGLIDLDHTLAMARRWGGLPVDTVVIEVEPAEASFGVGFTDVLANCLGPVLDLVREELAGFTARPVELNLDTVETADSPVGPSEDLADLAAYAESHAHARLLRHRSPAPPTAVAGVAVAGEVRPWGVFVECGGDWFDTVALPDGALGIVVGDVDGRGAEATAAMTDLRAAVQAYAVLDGGSPARLVRHLDRLAETTGMGRDARLLYLTVQPATGEVRYANAGACPPLLLSGMTASALEVPGAEGPLGAGGDRDEMLLGLEPGATLLLFTRGLVESRAVPRRAGLDLLRRAALEGPPPLKALCDHVLTTCMENLRRDDDICLVGVRLTGIADGARLRRQGAARGAADRVTVS